MNEWSSMLGFQNLLNSFLINMDASEGLKVKARLKQDRKLQFGLVIVHHDIYVISLIIQIRF